MNSVPVCFVAAIGSATRRDEMRCCDDEIAFLLLSSSFVEIILVPRGNRRHDRHRPHSHNRHERRWRNESRQFLLPMKSSKPRPIVVGATKHEAMSLSTGTGYSLLLRRVRVAFDEISSSMALNSQRRRSDMRC